MATLKWNRGYWVCSSCFMRLHELVPYCPFCNSEFSNYEEVMQEIWLNRQDDARIK